MNDNDLDSVMSANNSTLITQPKGDICQMYRVDRDLLISSKEERALI